MQIYSALHTLEVNQKQLTTHSRPVSICLAVAGRITHCPTRGGNEAILFLQKLKTIRQLCFYDIRQSKRWVLFCLHLLIPVVLVILAVLTGP